MSSKPITVPHKDRFLTIEFHRLEQPSSSPYNGPYQGRDELSPDDIKTVMEREYMSQTEMMRTLEALVSTVEGLKDSINWRLPLTLGAIVLLGFTSISIIVAIVIATLNGFNL